MNKAQKQGSLKPPPFTVKELMSMFSLTVEEALDKGYKVVGYKKAASETGTSSAAKINITAKL